MALLSYNSLVEGQGAALPGVSPLERMRPELEAGYTRSRVPAMTEDDNGRFVPDVSRLANCQRAWQTNVLDDGRQEIVICNGVATTTFLPRRLPRVLAVDVTTGGGVAESSLDGATVCGRRYTLTAIVTAPGRHFISLVRVGSRWYKYAFRELEPVDLRGVDDVLHTGAPVQMVYVTRDN
jgi:hypothetical protein